MALLDDKETYWEEVVFPALLEDPHGRGDYEFELMDEAFWLWEPDDDEYLMDCRCGRRMEAA